MKECTCGKFKGPLHIMKISDTLTIHTCTWCGGEVSRWEDKCQRPIIGKPRKLTLEEKRSLK